MSGRNQNNPWKSGPGGAHKFKIKPQKISQAPSIKDVEQRFQEARAKMQANVHKHIQDYESSSEEDDLHEDNILEKVLQNYNRADGDTGFNRTRNFLEECFQSGGSACLICIATVKRMDAIWNCTSCFTFFHLTCIQRWAQDTVSQLIDDDAVIAVSIRVHTFKKVEWCCPKCRQSYAKDEIPKKYECFCRKQVDPPFQPWLLPHSCGDICRKDLLPLCGHKCLLLCHPGPCPPCPKTILTKCHCGKSAPKSVRCSTSKWACDQKCGRLLSCQQHKCDAICHSGDCAPCQKTSLQSCFCGSEKIPRPCAEPHWQCNKVCGKKFACGNHRCERVCHQPGECGDCQLSGVRSCPCGSVTKEVVCPEVVPPCGDTCGKSLPCGLHQCLSKCHKDSCPPCAVVVEKRCRCGAHLKELPCSKEFTCETKCKGNRNCMRHPCARKCCPGKCPPCERQCLRQLKCRMHKCSAPCHSGLCFPCPQTSNVTCRCGETYVTVPCGRQRKVRPPYCSLPCKIPYTCGHNAANPHRCHFGPCPPCKGVCNEIYPSCGHKCSATCHAAVMVEFKAAEKPATPWEIKPARMEICKMSCPPCDFGVLVSCFGLHISEMLPCHAAKNFNCGRTCGAALDCGNHSCEMDCHPRVDLPEMGLVAIKCAPCRRECLKPRPKGCDHVCPIGRCHPPPCLPCTRPVRTNCHCGLTEMRHKCIDIQTAIVDTEFKEGLFSCGQQCIKNMPCGHRCRSLCHSGECNVNQICTKKTKVYCPCKRIKKEEQCNLVSSNQAIVDCDAVCDSIKEEERERLEQEEMKKKKEEQEKDRRELLEYEAKFGAKKKYKEKKRHQVRNNESLLIKWAPFLGAMFIGVVAASIFIYIEYFDD